MLECKMRPQQFSNKTYMSDIPLLVFVRELELSEVGVGGMACVEVGVGGMACVGGGEGSEGELASKDES